MISRKEQIYNRINTYIKKYGIQSFIKMTPHAMDRHLGLNDDQLIDRLFKDSSPTNDASVFDIGGKKSFQTVTYDRAVQSIPEHYKTVFPDQYRHVSNFIHMYRHINEGMELPRSFDIRTQYEIEDAKETEGYGFGLNNRF